MLATELAIVGAGPAGLAAAIEAARHGVEVTLIDENARPGGQLFKQIHKFFGSRQHGAGTRGVDLGARLLDDVRKTGVNVMLNTVAWGIFDGPTLALYDGAGSRQVAARAVLLCTGATENALAFPGWTLPGVLGAGAAQTMVNLHRVLPGQRVLTVGAGNVGLIVSFQLLQAGAGAVTVVEALPRIGGYAVHAAKLARAGVPILTSTTIVEACGEDGVVAAVVAGLDAAGRPDPRTARRLDVDTICLAVGLSPLAELAFMAGCQFAFVPELGGHVPVHDEGMATTVPGIYVAGDVAGIEEASTAMDEGRLAGLSIAAALGRLAPDAAESEKKAIRARLDELRAGPFGERVRAGKSRLVGQAGAGAGVGAGRACGTPAAAPAAAPPGPPTPAERASCPADGVLGADTLRRLPGVPSPERLRAGPVAVIECPQEIPCDPCQAACKKGAIAVGPRLTSLPRLDDSRCTGCGLCVPACPGQAVFVVDQSGDDGSGTVMFPWEFLPRPEPGAAVRAADRRGRPLGPATVVAVKDVRGFDRTPVVTLRVGRDIAMEVRGLVRGVGA